MNEIIHRETRTYDRNHYFPPTGGMLVVVENGGHLQLHPAIPGKHRAQDCVFLHTNARGKRTAILQAGQSEPLVQKVAQLIGAAFRNPLN